MSTDYKTRAAKFARVLAAMFEGCEGLADFEAAVHYYNDFHSRKLRYSYGVTRFVIIRADYVIKFNMVPVDYWRDGRAGNNQTEKSLYDFAVSEGMGHLFAECTIISINGMDITIMPRINRVEDSTRYYEDFCSEDELDWLSTYVCDLHDGNLGYKNGKVCVIDYAWKNEGQKSLTFGPAIDPIQLSIFVASFHYQLSILGPSFQPLAPALAPLDQPPSAFVQLARRHAHQVAAMAMGAILAPGHTWAPSFDMVGSGPHGCSSPPLQGEEHPGDLLVDQLRLIQLDLDIDPVHPDIPGDPEGGGVFDPALAGQLFGQQPFEVLALVELIVSFEELFAAQFDRFALSDQGSFRGSRSADPDLQHATLRRRRAVVLQQLRQLFPREHRIVQAAADGEAVRVRVRGALRGIQGFHLFVRHGVFPPLLCTLIIHLSAAIVNGFL